MSIEDFGLILKVVARRHSGLEAARLDQRVCADLGIVGEAALLFREELERIFDVDLASLGEGELSGHTLGDIAGFIEACRMVGGPRKAVRT